MREANKMTEKKGLERVLLKTVKSKKVWLGFGSAIILFLPLILPSYIHIFIEFFILALFALSFNLVFGYGGMISFGHAAFYATGGYTCALLIKNFGLPLLLALSSSMLTAALVGIVVGYFVVRLPGFYLAFLSLAFGQLIWVIIWKWYSLTGGENGIVGISLPPLIFSLKEPWRFYYFILFIVIASLFLLRIIANSCFGRLLCASRDNSERAEFIGANLMKIRLIAWGISALFSGLAGSLMTLSLRGAFPDMAHWMKSGEVTLMALVGGMYAFSGPIIGAMVFIFLHYFLTRYMEHWMIIMGVVLVLLVIFLRNGIAGYFGEQFQTLKRRYGA